MSALKRQTEECALKKETTLHHMEAVLSVVENISKERDQLLHMVLMLLILYIVSHDVFKAKTLLNPFMPHKACVGDVYSNAEWLILIIE